MLLFQMIRWVGLLISLFVPCDGSLQLGFSKLQRGHRLDKTVIQSFAQLSFLDCVMECLVTPRCKSVNYFKGANFCEINYENKFTADTKYEGSAGWVYSEKEDWPNDLAGSCSNANCEINQTCKHKKYSEDKSFECVISDCGLPNQTGLDLSKTKREDAIGIHRRIHASCSEGYCRFGSGRLICQSNGEWKYDIVCEEGWARFGYHIYRLFADQKTWLDAKDICKSKGAYIAEIDSVQENEWIHRTLVLQHFTRILNLTNENIYEFSVWTGGSDQQVEGMFVWSDSRDNFTFTNWKGNQPDNAEPMENCVQMVALTGEWNDRSCSHNTYFVCEKGIQ